MIKYYNSAWQDVLPDIRNADLVICDPVYKSKDLSYLQASVDTLRAGGSLYVFGDSSRIAETKLALDAIADMQFQNWLIMGPQDWGGRSKTRWGQKHDDILFYTKRGARHTFNASAVAVSKLMIQKAFNPSKRDWKIPHSVWLDIATFSTVSKERVKVREHTVRWQKPEKVIERIVLASSNVDDLVIDPFGGVATVPFVCKRLDRRCISSEIDQDIYDAGVKRLE